MQATPPAQRPGVFKFVTAHTPDSVRLAPVRTITLSGLLGHEGGTPVDRLGLAPRGVCLAARVTLCAVRSCRTFSPLPEGGMFSVALSVYTVLTPYSPSFRMARYPVESGSSSPVARGGSLGRQIVSQIKTVDWSFLFWWPCAQRV